LSDEPVDVAVAVEVVDDVGGTVAVDVVDDVLVDEVLVVELVVVEVLVVEVLGAGATVPVEVLEVVGGLTTTLPEMRGLDVVNWTST
jgi:hypothetical protein